MWIQNEEGKDNVRTEAHRHRHIYTSKRTEKDVGVTHDHHAQRAGDLHGVGLSHVRSVGEETTISMCLL